MAAAWTRLPTPWAGPAGAAPPCRSSSQRRLQRRALSIEDGVTLTGSPGSASGRSSDSERRPHHSSGCAPGTPARASSASSAAAARRRPGAASGATTAVRSSATSAASVNARGGRPAGTSSCSSIRSAPPSSAPGRCPGTGGLAVITTPARSAGPVPSASASASVGPGSSASRRRSVPRGSVGPGPFGLPGSGGPGSSGSSGPGSGPSGGVSPGRGPGRASSARKRLGCSSPSAPPTPADATAVTTNRRRARVVAT